MLAVTIELNLHEDEKQTLPQKLSINSTKLMIFINDEFRFETKFYTIQSQNEIRWVKST